MNTKPRFRLWIWLPLLAAGCAQGLTAQQRAVLDEGRAAYERQQYSRAIERLSDFVTQVKHQPEEAQAFYLRGMAYARSGQRDRAYSDFRSAIMVGRDTEAVWRSYTVLGTLYWEDERWHQAAQNLRAAADRMPDRPPKDTVLARLGMCYERTGRWADARGPFEEIRRKFPGSSHAELARRRLLLKPDHFSVQCGAFAQAANADMLRVNLARRNLPVSVRVEPRERANMHLVLVGRFATYEEARRQLERIRATAGDLAPDPIIWP